LTILTIDQLIEDVIAREGGYVDHPADRGGPTRWGITQSVARNQGYDGDMRQLPRANAQSIYRRLYWISPGFDKIAKLCPRIAAELFDSGINMGTGTAAGFLQRALNALNRNARDYADISVDRRVGPETIAALTQFMAVRGSGIMFASPKHAPLKKHFYMDGSPTVSVNCKGPKL
jgi:lysozyme family protein